jgi:hypothetical protein
MSTMLPRRHSDTYYSSTVVGTKVSTTEVVVYVTMTSDPEIVWVSVTAQVVVYVSST